MHKRRRDPVRLRNFGPSHPIIRHRHGVPRRLDGSPSLPGRRRPTLTLTCRRRHASRSLTIHIPWHAAPARRARLSLFTRRPRCRSRSQDVPSHSWRMLPIIVNRHVPQPRKLELGRARLRYSNNRYCVHRPLLQDTPWHRPRPRFSNASVRGLWHTHGQRLGRCLRRPERHSRSVHAGRDGTKCRRPLLGAIACGRSDLALGAFLSIHRLRTFRGAGRSRIGEPGLAEDSTRRLDP